MANIRSKLRLTSFGAMVCASKLLIIILFPWAHDLICLSKLTTCILRSKSLDPYSNTMVVFFSLLRGLPNVIFATTTKFQNPMLFLSLRLLLMNLMYLLWWNGQTTLLNMHHLPHMAHLKFKTIYAKSK
jgi:hypothetical protein